MAVGTSTPSSQFANFHELLSLSKIQCKTSVAKNP